MTQTLRRELRNKFEGILRETFAYTELWDAGSLAEKLSDAALELRGFQFQPKTIEQAILAGVPVTDKIIQAGDNREALTDFERVFGFGELPWWSNTVWDKFRKWIVKQHAAGWFADYVAWRNGDGKYRAFSNKKIRENPAAFMDTGYPEYEASKMYRKTDEQRTVYAAVPERVRTPRPANVPPPNIPKRSLNDNTTDRE